MINDFDDSFKESEIQRLEGEIYELKDKLQSVTDRELIYKEILTEIKDSINELIKRDKENERFRFEDKVNYKEFVNNLKDDLINYKRVYRNQNINF